MSKLLLSTTAAVVSFALASAAAGTASAQNPDTGTNFWEGFYVGANVGGSWGDTKLSTTVTPGSGAAAISAADAAAISAAAHDTSNKAGFTGGIQAGYNYLFQHQWLLGVEGDWEGMDIRSSSSRPVASASVPGGLYTINQEVKAGWLATLRPRVGYAFNRYLIFGSIGFAWADLKYQASLTNNRGLAPVSSSSSTTKTGWAGGIGGAYAFTTNWQMRAEWLYANLGHANAATVVGTGATIKPQDDVAANLVRVGIDYRF